MPRETCWDNQSVEILVLPRSTGHMLTSLNLGFLFIKVEEYSAHIPLNGSVIFLRSWIWTDYFSTKLKQFIVCGYLWISPVSGSTHSSTVLHLVAFFYELMLTLISNFCQEKEEHDTVVMTVNYKSFEWLIPESGCWHNFLLCKLSNEVMQGFLKWASVCVALHPTIYS